MTRAPAQAIEQALRLLDAGRAGEAQAALEALRQRYPDDPEPWRLLGLLALQAGAPARADELLEQARQRAPDSPVVLCNLGALARQRGDDTGAERLYRQALQHDAGCVPALNNLAGLLFAQQRWLESERLYRAALARAPEHAAARGNLAACLLALDRGREALLEAELATRSAPGYAPAWLALAQVRQALGQHDAAAEAFQRAIALGLRSPDTLYGLAQCLDDTKQWPDAIRLCEQVLAIDSRHAPAASLAQYLRRHLCQHEALAEGEHRLFDLLDAGVAGIAPFAFLSESATPAQQLCVATRAAVEVQQRVQARATTLTPATASPRSSDERLRVGFVSSGFGQHPTALLIVELIEQLRDSPIETVGYATTPDDGGALRQRLRAGFAQWRDVSGDSYSAMATRVRADAPDVLIDLRGWGGGSVAELFAQRPAPVQVNWLAYPGSSGAPWIDHLIADRFVIPEDERRHYSESVVYLPRCFQPSDGTRVIAEPPPREAFGLPPDAVVFACFNNAYKYSPESVARFWRILRDVPTSVLWLLDGKHTLAGENLRRLAAADGIDPQRLLFLPKQPHERYLACYRHADLFLDTTPYNAHTTASDALWAGCPVLTRPGHSFAARVAGSLNHHLGLDDMNAGDDDAFVARAVALGLDAGARAQLCDRLQAARRDRGVFDMTAFARDFASTLLDLAQRPTR